MPYALLSNSGTSAIFSMFEGLNLQPGDEVLCPVYTFHATISPLMYTGATPVFCDCDSSGNICIEEIKSRYTEKTKAIIITHMWGMPVSDTPEIVQFCFDKGIPLLEDCSHAHGATINGQKVGSFGMASAWSLQGQKTITGGEGGIMLTRSKTIFERALLQGHYNKRPKTEINQDSPMYKYYLTGFGQKLRAHPLAIRLALNQFNKLDSMLSQRRIFADRIADSLQYIPFLEVLTPPQGTTVSNYALIIKYKEQHAFGVTRESFVDALHAEGLCEADIPSSTGPIHTQPLFNTPHEILPRLYCKPLNTQTDFPQAELFHHKIIKFPVWTFSEDAQVVDNYIVGIKKIADYILENKNLT